MKATGSTIINHIKEMIESKSFVDQVQVQSNMVQGAKVATRINIRQVEDTEFDEWSSIDSEGRSLELDFEIGVRIKPKTEDIHANQAAQAAFDTATGIGMQITSLLSENQSILEINGARILAEASSQREDVDTDDSDNILARLDLEYSFLYRVKRNAPDILT